MRVVAPGFCQCGCGERTRVAEQSRSARGWIKGQPKRFVANHGAKRSGLAPGKVRVGGYIGTLMTGHPRADRNGYVREHLLVAEKAVGRPIKHSERVHHVDGSRDNNEPSNLVVCQNEAYHALLHARQRAVGACGNPDWRPCSYCHRYDDPTLMRSKGDQWNNYVHAECSRSYSRLRRRRKKASQ